MSTKYAVSWRLWLMLLRCSLQTANIASWSVTQSPAFEEVLVGRPVRLKCHFSGMTSEINVCETIVWTKVHPRTGGLDVIYPTSKTNENFKVNTSTESCDLIIVGQSQDDSGMYYCWPKTSSLRICGNGSRVVFTENVTASVELFLSPIRNSSIVSFICWAKKVVPSQVRVFWIVNGHEYSGLLESIWLNDSHFATEFTQSRFWSTDWNWEAGMQCKCVVEFKGRNISKTINHISKFDNTCSVLVYGISFTSLFIIVGWVVVVIYQGRRSEKLHRRKFSKHVSDSAGTFSNEVQYASVNTTNFSITAGLRRDNVSKKEAEISSDN